MQLTYKCFLFPGNTFLFVTTSMWSLGPFQGKAQCQPGRCSMCLCSPVLQGAIPLFKPAASCQWPWVPWYHDVAISSASTSHERPITIMISRAPGPSFSVGKIQKTRDALTGGVEILSHGWLINSSLCLFSFNPFLATLPAAKRWYVIHIYSGHWWKIRFLSMWYQCSQPWGKFCIFNHLSDPVYENQSSLVPVLIFSVCIALCYCVFWFCLLTPHSGTFIQDASVILLCRWSPGSVSRIQMMAVFLRAWLCCCWDDSLSSLHLLLWVLMKLMCTLVLPKPSLRCQIRNSSAWAAEWDPPLINPSLGDWLLGAVSSQTALLRPPWEGRVHLQWVLWCGAWRAFSTRQELSTAGATLTSAPLQEAAVGNLSPSTFRNFNS